MQTYCNSRSCNVSGNTESKKDSIFFLVIVCRNWKIFGFLVQERAVISKREDPYQPVFIFF